MGHSLATLLLNRSAASLDLSAALLDFPGGIALWEVLLELSAVPLSFLGGIALLDSTVVSLELSAVPIGFPGGVALLNSSAASLDFSAVPLDFPGSADSSMPRKAVFVRALNEQQQIQKKDHIPGMGKIPQHKNLAFWL